MVILIKDVVKSKTAISYEDGEKCLQMVIDGLQNNEKVILDFAGIDFVITAFLNPVIGDLIIKFGSNIMQQIEIRNATKNIIEKIKIVKNGALVKREDLEEN